MKIGICDTILALNPTAQVSCSGDDINQIEWLSNTPVIANDIILYLLNILIVISKTI